MFYYDNDLLIITKYQRLLTLTEEEIYLIFKNFNLKITGSNLNITYLEKSEMHLKGNIQVIMINKVG